MSRGPLPKSRGKEKGKLASRDQVQGYTATRETKVDPIFENTDEQYQRGDELSLDEEPDPEEQLYRKILKEKNEPSFSQDHPIKRRTGERVQMTQEQDDGDDKNKVTVKKVAQKPQPEQIFTTAFKPMPAIPTHQEFDNRGNYDHHHPFNRFGVSDRRAGVLQPL